MALAILTSTLYGGECLISRPSRFNPGKKCDIQSTEGCVGWTFCRSFLNLPRFESRTVQPMAWSLYRLRHSKLLDNTNNYYYYYYYYYYSLNSGSTNDSMTHHTSIYCPDAKRNLSPDKKTVKKQLQPIGAFADPTVKRTQNLQIRTASLSKIPNKNCPTG